MDDGTHRLDGFSLGAYDGDMTLGRWGVDPTDNVVWAVVNHNSQFASTPEPGTTALLVVGAVGLIRRRRKPGR